jgi:hypothetical protein
MEICRSFALVILIAISGVICSTDNSSASPIAKLSTTSLNLITNEQSPVLNVKLFKRGHKRRHGRRYHRRHRGYGGYSGFGSGPGDIWYSRPIYVQPVIIVRPQFNLRSNQCTKWSRMCAKNWRTRPNFIGCMRFHRCR